MKNKTFRELWRYCYSQARQINSYLRAAKLEMEAGNANDAMRMAMQAGELISHAETGYSPAGSVYVYRYTDRVEFEAYTANGDRYEIVFPFGDNTPRNKRAEANRREWQVFTQQLESQLLEEKLLFARMAERRELRSKIAFYLSFMSDEGLHKAYDVIKGLSELSC